MSKQMCKHALCVQVASVIGGLRRQTSTLKPFNPILGETYQAQYSSGLQVYAEQISHHPPVSSWQVKDAKGRVRLCSANFPHLHAWIHNIPRVQGLLPGEGR